VTAPKSGAERQRAYRERMAALKGSELEQAEVAEARQASLPIAPIAPLEDIEAVKPGRPAGSVKRSTAELRAMFLSRFRSPVMAMGEIYSRPTTDLARQLGCTRLEAMKLQLDCMEKTARFIHSPMPIAVVQDGPPVAPVTVGVFAQAAPNGVVRAGAVIGAPQILPNQTVIEGDKS